MKAKNKYGVSAKSERTYNGKVYDSKLEMNYRKHLELLTKASNPIERVTHILEQVPFEIKVNGIKICTYIADFRVIYSDSNRDHEYIDCKGFKTPEYKLKKKLVEALYPIKIKEVTKGKF